MNKISSTQTIHSTLVDVRSQFDFQVAHAKGSLNLSSSNLSKYALNFLATDQAITFVVEDDSPETLSELTDKANAIGLTNVQGYVLFAELPADSLQSIDTISAEDFLSLPIDDSFTLLDLRQAAEITRPAPDRNLSNIPIEELAKEYTKLEEKQKIYTLCGSGGRATAAASFLSDKGYKPIVITGGMKAVQALNK